MKSRIAVIGGVVGLLAFPLAGASLVARVLEPLPFVGISLLALAAFGASTMALHDAVATPEAPAAGKHGARSDRNAHLVS